MTGLAQDLADLGEAVTTAPAGGRRPPHLDAAAGWRVTITSEFADVENDATAERLQVASDWDGVLIHFGLNPDEFEIVDDTVRISSWEQSKRLENGDRDTVTLFAYRARFRRVLNRLPEADVHALRAHVREWRPQARKAVATATTDAESTFYVGWADWQFGKEVPDGQALTEDRILDSFDQALDRVRDLRRLGRNVRRLAIANMGDPTEGCDGQYASQLSTIRMHRRDQLTGVLDLWLAGLRALAPYFDEVDFLSVLCNHGEWMRTGGPGSKQVTSDSDNIGGYLPETLQRVLAGRGDFEHVRFTIPRSEMSVFTTLSGIPVAATHGHKSPTGSKQELDWLRGQSIRLLREHGTEPRLWLTAHRHHYEIKDYGPWTRIQHPSMDHGSKWYEDATGQWSTPGTFTCLIGEHQQAGGPLRLADGSVSQVATGFSDEHVLVPAA